MIEKVLMLGSLILEFFLCVRIPHLCVCGKEYELYGWKKAILF